MYFPRTDAWCSALLLLCCTLYYPLSAQIDPNLNASTAQEAIWVDSVFNTLSQDEKIGQLFMLRAHSNLGADHIAKVERLVKDYHVGGLCFFQGTPEKQVELINRYQPQARLPLMIAIDGEWGLGMRMKESTISFPYNLTLGAIRDNALLYRMGREMARQMHRVGVHVNFAPVVDVNNNADNPVIGRRSFGEDRVNVALKGIQLMRGMQDHGILACAKHFPGHGDTNLDSHYDLPKIPHSRARLDSIELYPFRALIQHGVGSLMVGHLEVPKLEAEANRPTSLSRSTVTDLLRNELQFKGLTFTDGLGMQGVAKHFPKGEVEAQALLAGNDVLLLPQDLAAAQRTIKTYLEDSRLNEVVLDEKVRRVLRMKYRLGLTQFITLPTGNLREDLNSGEAQALREELIAHALTLVRNGESLVPINRVGEMKIGALALGSTARTHFQQRLLDYAPVTNWRLGTNPSSSEINMLLERAAQQDLLIVSLHGMSRSAKDNYGVSESNLALIRQLAQRQRIILVVFGYPYSLQLFDEVECVVEAYENGKSYQDLAAQALFGAIGLNGRLPVTASAKSRFNAGVSTSKSFRMGYSTPEQVGMDSDSLRLAIDELAAEAIRKRATPGCVVLVARHGKIVFEQAYGRHTYSRESRRTQTTDVYDLASITKVAATTMSIMHLVQRGEVDLDKGLGAYLPELQGTNKAQLKLRDVLAHRAALKPWIPFYTSTLKENGSRDNKHYRTRSSGPYSVQVTDRLYLHETWKDSLWHYIAESDLRSNTNYRYSDLGFYYLGRVVERISGMSLDAYARKHFYQPLGLQNIAFNPRQYFSESRIPPTEQDRYWRGQRVQGYVHDMGAAMLGGVAGHAGLFGNAHDVAVVGQMLLQRGVYGNQVFIKPGLIREFTSRHPRATRRGLGFDMKQLDPKRTANVAYEASERTFGHLGFTGTSVWADPAEELLVVFLSNRTYPSMDNNKLGRINTRLRIQEAAYRAITVPVRPSIPPVTPIASPNLPAEVKSVQ